ncbi:MAG: peptidoglycan-associated lipoprotein Pal [Gammaproteobacteria bacterium]|nr:peptidoglycan-associated lipoprotein Pal [Gammaproteobacteria bacterium]
MRRTILMGLLTVTTAWLLVGCSNLDKKAAAPANVENRGISGDEMSDIDAAKSQGMGDGSGADASALNDPNSPLSTRVIYFDYDSTNIRADFEGVVQAHATYLAANPEVEITLEGHADERGTPEYNLALGERRALALRRQLVLLGSTAGQIRTVSYGEERPVAEGHDEQSYGLNRRAEIIYP